MLGIDGSDAFVAREIGYSVADILAKALFALVIFRIARLKSAYDDPDYAEEHDSTTVMLIEEVDGVRPTGVAEPGHAPRGARPSARPAPRRPDLTAAGADPGADAARADRGAPVATVAQRSSARTTMSSSADRKSYTAIR